MKHILKGLGLAIFLVPSALIGGFLDCNRCKETPPKPQAECNPCGECVEESCTVCGDRKSKSSCNTCASPRPKELCNPCARPRRCKDSGAYPTADALLWQASEPDLTYATKAVHGSSLFYLNNAKAHNPNFKWEFGFRAGIVFRIPHGHWDTYLNYTWFQDRATSRTSNNDGYNLLYSNFVHSALGNDGDVIFAPLFVKAIADWKLRLQIADWEWGRKFSPATWFAFRPHAGARAAWVQQNYKITYIDSTSQEGVRSGENVFVRMSNNYWGAGIRAGFDSQWFFSKNWSLYGNAALSLLWGTFDLDQRETSTVSDSDPTVLLSIENNYYAGRAVTDLQFGIRWQATFNDNGCLHGCAFTLQAGWEQHVFFEQNEFMHFNDVSNTANFTQSHGNLSVQGGTVAARFDF